MLFTENPIPSDAPAWRVREALRLREWFRNDTDEIDGILRWKSNGRVVPASSYRDAFCLPPEGSAETERQENEAFLAAYRSTPRHYDEETLAEMRNEFGEGAVVVDILSGQRTRL